MTQIDQELLLMRLYRIFNIKRERYATEVKLLYIYKWVEPTAQEVSFDVISTLRKCFKHDSNQKNLDEFYHALKALTLINSGRYDTSTTNLPMNPQPYDRGRKVS